MRRGRVLDGFSDRHPLPEDALRDKKVLRRIEHVRQRRPQLLRLMVQRRSDQEPDADEYADDEEIENEYREPSWKATGADWQRLLALDQPHDGAESDGEESTHVDEEQDVSHQVCTPHHNDRECSHRDRPENQ